jgi:uncharacterized protein YhaN
MNLDSIGKVRRLPLRVLLFCVMLCGCQAAYYGAMEKVGYHKRDILVNRVEAARDSQEEAKEQFESALERFSAVLDFHGGELEDKYRQLKQELDRSEAKAGEVRERIASVEDVAADLFAEWERELGQYTSASLRRSSQEKLEQTRRSYGKLIAAMKRVEARIEPVLTPLRDQVLYLKHNLNAQAIASLRSELVAMETDVSSLIREMEASIAEADKFIRTLSDGG